MANYEATAKVRLVITKNKVGGFRLYRCSSHKNCHFFGQFGRKRRDGRYVLKKYSLEHKGIVLPTLNRKGYWRLTVSTGVVVQYCGTTEMEK